VSPILVGLVVVALVGVMVGVQVSANQLQRFPVDTRNAGSLLDVTRHSAFTVRPAELDKLTAIVEESLASGTVARAKLGPLLDELGRLAPDTQGRPAPPPGRGRRARTRWLDEELTALERRWGTHSPRASG
jgi:hypothetical protein